MRTIALGVDGMEPSLCQRWIDEGQLPNIARIRQTGAFGTAECASLISARQWTTHFTGVGASTHGVTGFIRKDEVEHTRDDQPQTRVSIDTKKLINTSDINTKTYPELLSEQGIKVGLINPLPIWPPLELQGGFCVAGLVTPPTADSYVYPESLKPQVEEMGYRIDVQYGDRPFGFIDDLLFTNNEIELDQLREDMFDVLNRRIAFTKRKIADSDAKVLYSLLKTIDIIQHTFWAHMEQDDAQYGDCILKSYRRVDDLVGWVRENEPEANLIIFGDHGFGPRRDPRFDIVHSLGYLADTYLPIPYRIKAAYRKHLKNESDANLNNVDGITGDHSNPTACMMAGPDINKTSLDISFEDITPTLVALTGEPVPTQYIGTVPDDAVRVVPEYKQISLKPNRSRSSVSDQVSERLYNLGYAEMVDE